MERLLLVVAMAVMAGCAAGRQGAVGEPDPDDEAGETPQVDVRRGGVDASLPRVDPPDAAGERVAPDGAAVDRGAAPVDAIGDRVPGALDGASAATMPPDMKPVLAAIFATIKSASARTNASLGVVWLPTGARATVDGERPVESASSPKWIWAMAALYAKSISVVEPPALPTFRTSDNSAAGTLIDLAGGPNAVNDFTSKTLGIPSNLVSLCRWNADKTRVATNCSSARGGGNFITVSGALSFLEHAWKRSAIGPEKGDKLLEWARLSPRSGYGGWLGTQLPSAPRAGMHHKAGWLPPGCCSNDAVNNIMNEIGIVSTPRGWYGVVILLGQGADYWGKQTRSMEWASCVIWHAYARDVEDPFKAGCAAP